MDKETLEKIGGKVIWIEVPYTTTKLSVETGKNKWQTAGGDTIIARVEVGSEAEPDAVFNATREWLKQLAVEANEATLKTLNKAYKAYHQPVLQDAPVAKKPPVAQNAQQQQSGLLEDVPEDWCPIHNCQMTKRPKGWQPGQEYWFSHKDGEAWCRGE